LPIAVNILAGGPSPGRDEVPAMFRSTSLAVVLLAAGVPAADDKPVVTATDGRIDFRLRDDLVTSYHTPPRAAQPYFWPLNVPGGVAVTRAWPLDKSKPVTTDHEHHVSAWFTYGEVDGIDFWSLGRGHGVIVCIDPGTPERNHVRTRNEWRTADGRKVLDETRTIAVEGVVGGRLIVVSTELTPAGEPVTFGDTKEGAFAVRVSDQLRVRDKKGSNAKSRITNADGKTGENGCWGYPSDWCDYSGEVDGKAVGVAIFDDPANKPRSCWHVRDYGLMAANPFGRAKSGFPAMRGRTDLVRLPKDEHLRLRYAIYLHDGDAAAGKVKDAFERFVRMKN
jgi:hypothetical protein